MLRKSAVLAFVLLGEAKPVSVLLLRSLHCSLDVSLSHETINITVTLPVETWIRREGCSASWLCS